mgnify:CR=1 FL=1
MALNKIKNKKLCMERCGKKYSGTLEAGCPFTFEECYEIIMKELPELQKNPQTKDL